MIAEIALSLLVLFGGFFAFVAALGILRLPDVLIRMHASTKAGTLSIGLIMGVVAWTFADTATVAKSTAILSFMLLTAPVGAHMIGRAAFRSGVPLWTPTKVDPSALEQLGQTNEDPVDHNA